MNPTARSIAKLKADGYCVATVERWIPTTPAGYRGPLLRKDAFGFADLLLVKVGVIGATLVQVTTGDNHSKRLDKIKASAEAAIWLAAGNRILLTSWSKKGKAGKRKLWEARDLWIDAETLNGHAGPHPTPVQNHR